MISNNINKVGMSILLNFSIPFLTPRMTTKWVSTMKATVHSNGFTGSEEKALEIGCHISGVAMDATQHGDHKILQTPSCHHGIET